MAVLDEPVSEPVEPEDLASKSIEAGRLLWHYTSFAGLQGIVGGAIWASSLPYLNDTQEFRYGIEVALAALQEALAGELPHLGEIRQQLTEFFRDRYKPNDVYSVSFSTEDDDLSQWRAYGGPGPSFAIGFDARALELQALRYRFQLFEVIYDDDRIKEDARRELQEQIDEARNPALLLSTNAKPAHIGQIHTVSLASRLMGMGPRYKHPKFSAEREWRLIRRLPVIADKPRFVHRFRQSGSLVVPYVEFPLHTLPNPKDVFDNRAHAQSPIAAVKIGPTPHPAELKHAVGELVARAGLPLVEVTSSGVPYRNW